MDRLESRLEALEEQVRKLSDFYESYHRLERKRIDEARLYAARHGGELITRRDMQRMKGVPKITVDQWVAEPDFPTAVQVTRQRAYLYSRAAFDEWYERHILKPKVKARMERGK